MSDQEKPDQINYKQLYEELQSELKRQILLAHFNQQMAMQQNAKAVYMFFQGWKEGCIKLLNGQIRKEVEENLQHAEKNLDMKSVLEILEQSLTEGKSLI